MTCLIEFSRGWIDASKFEDALRNTSGPHQYAATEVHFAVGCKIMIDVAVRLLSLFNQLDSCTRRVSLYFTEGESGAMGYLDRMGFFDHLAPNIAVNPPRPIVSGAAIYRGHNSHLVEIARINRHVRDRELPSKLADALMEGCNSRPDASELGGAAWTIFAELIDNVFSHSETKLDGYAALQLYSRGLCVAVSDSGLGIMETLRPALKHEQPTLARLPDLDLLVEIFHQGISRHGADRGCGLKGSAAKAMKYNARLDVRLPNSRVLLVPGTGGYHLDTTYCYDQLPLIWGTHICFKFSLDSRK